MRDSHPSFYVEENKVEYDAIQRMAEKLHNDYLDQHPVPYCYKCSAVVDDWIWVKKEGRWNLKAWCHGESVLAENIQKYEGFYPTPIPVVFSENDSIRHGVYTHDSKGGRDFHIELTEAENRELHEKESTLRVMSFLESYSSVAIIVMLLCLFAICVWSGLFT